MMHMHLSIFEVLVEAFCLSGATLILFNASDVVYQWGRATSAQLLPPNRLMRVSFAMATFALWGCTHLTTNCIGNCHDPASKCQCMRL